MRDFFFQIVMFLAGAIIGIIVPILDEPIQKRIATILAVILVATSLLWAGYEWGASDPNQVVGVEPPPDTPTPTLGPTEISTSKPTNTPIPSTDTPTLTIDEAFVGTWTGTEQIIWEGEQGVGWEGGMVLIITEVCRVGRKCAVLNFPTSSLPSCSSVTLSLVEVQDKALQFQRESIQGECDPNGQGRVELFDDGTLVYIGGGDNWEGEGILRKIED